MSFLFNMIIGEIGLLFDFLSPSLLCLYAQDDVKGKNNGTRDIVHGEKHIDVWYERE